MLPTIIIASIIAVIFIAIVVKGIVNIKKGKGICSCGCSCGECSMSEYCHGNKK